MARVILSRILSVLLYEVPWRCVRQPNSRCPIARRRKLIQVQLKVLQHDSGLAGLFESLIFGVQHVGNFNSTYSSGLPHDGYDHDQ